MRSFLIIVISFSLVLTALSLPNAVGAEKRRQQQQKESATDTKTLERGRHLVKIAGCNDCHTQGYLELEGNVPEDQ